MEDYATLGSIVEEYIIQEGYDTTHNFPRLYNLAIRGLKNLHYDVSGEPTYTILELDENNLADVPAGLVKVRSMNFMSRGGLVPINETKTKNPWTINTSGQEVRPIAETEVDPSDATAYQLYFSPEVDAARWKNGEFIGHTFAGANGNPYTYLRNYDTNKFEFSSNVNGVVLLDFLQNPQMIDEKFRVHPYTELPILNWLEWKDKGSKPYTPLGEKMYLKKQYFASKRWAKMQYNSTSTQEIRNGQRKNYSLTPK